MVPAPGKQTLPRLFSHPVTPVVLLLSIQYNTTTSLYLSLRTKVVGFVRLLNCSHEVKRCLLLEKKAMTNLDSILKSRDITLPTKVHIVEAMVFPVVMYGCESWTIKKTECWSIDAFKLWWRRRLLRVPWTARRSTSKSYRRWTLNSHWKDWCWSWSYNTLAT